MKKTTVATGVVAVGIIGSVPMAAGTSPQNDTSPSPVSIELSNGDYESSKLVSSIGIVPAHIINNNCSYSRDHIWVQMEGNNCILGLTDNAQNQLGDIVFVDVNTVGESIEQNRVFGTVESVKAVTDLFMPVSGEIIEYNSLLGNNPGLINTDPYGRGWIVKVKMEHLSELSELMNSDEYDEYCRY